MDNNETLKHRLLHNKTILFLGIFALFVFVLLILLPLISFFTDTSQDTPIASISPTPLPGFSEKREIKKYTTLQKTIIGRTTETELEKNNTIVSKKPLPNSATKYVLDSELPGHTNDVITRDGRVIFEATPIFTNKYGPLPYIAQYIIDNGNPEEIIKGNERWGWHTSTYLYPKKGLLFVANTFTSEIYEIIRFTPMTLAEFRSTFPEYLESEGPKDHGHYPVSDGALQN